MVSDLVSKLRTCPDSQRKDVAIRLAQTKSDEAVDELIRMVQGEVRIYTPRTLKTWFRKIPIVYSDQDQLIGIEALAETGHMKALNFLNRLYTCDTHISVGSASAFQGYDEVFATYTSSGLVDSFGNPAYAYPESYLSKWSDEAQNIIQNAIVKLKKDTHQY